MDPFGQLKIKNYNERHQEKCCHKNFVQLESVAYNSTSRTKIKDQSGLQEANFLAPRILSEGKRHKEAVTFCH